MVSTNHTQGDGRSGSHQAPDYCLVCEAVSFSRTFPCWPHRGQHSRRAPSARMLHPLCHPVARDNPRLLPHPHPPLHLRRPSGGRQIAKGPVCLPGERTAPVRTLHWSETDDEPDLGCLAEWPSLRCECPGRSSDHASMGLVCNHGQPELSTVDADSKSFESGAAF